MHRIATVHKLIEMWQGGQNLCTTHHKSPAENKQMSAVEYISDMEERVKASWSNFQPDGAAAFKLSERSLLPQALSAKALTGGRTQVIIVHQIRQIDHHPGQSDDDSTPKGICDTDVCFSSNGDLDNRTESQEDREAELDSNVELDNVFEDPE